MYTDLLLAEMETKRVCLARHIAASSLTADEYAYRCVDMGLGWSPPLMSVWLEFQQSLEAEAKP